MARGGPDPIQLMNKTRPIVVLGLLGIKLDGGFNAKRWSRWRPSVGIFQQEDLACARFELLYEENHRLMASTVAEDVKVASPATEVRLHPLRLKDPWDFGEVYAALHDFATTYRFRTDEEDYLVHITTGTHVVQICLFLLTESRHLPARLLQTSPPTGRSSAPGGTYSIIDLDLSRYDALARRFAKEHAEGAALLKSGILTQNARWNRIIEELEYVSLQTTSPILVTGPTGAGKSQLARRIFELKQSRHRLSGPFVEVNCATLRGDQAMSSLFGHLRGAFTGAQVARAGLLKSADGGVLFLDEIGELGLDEQAMLLRALEEKRFFPVGSDSETESDFQLIAGTNRDLRQAVRSGLFREDLLARINLWTFEIPPLSERREDIEPNLDYELDRFAAKTTRRCAFNREARDRYLEFAKSPAARWNGNFRDLNASVTRMATLAPGGRIDLPIVGKEIDRLLRDWSHQESLPSLTDSETEATLRAVLKEPAMKEIDLFDAVQLATVIRVCQTSKTLSEAGRTLFAASRARKAASNDADRLRKYLARFQLTFHDVARRPS